MGNTITTNFDVKDQIAVGGPGYLWKVHNSIKKTNNQSCAIFQKNVIDKLNPLSKPTQAKKEQERINEILKKEAQMLSRLRHPSIVEVIEAADDSRIAIAFASEALLFNLGNIYSYESGFKGKHELDELEIQKGILQIAKGLQFLHSNRIIHVGLCLDAIYVNAKGDWKISGFNFSMSTAEGENAQLSTFIYHYPSYCSPALEYLAPEVVNDDRCFASSDLWSFGCMIFSLFNTGNSPVKCNQNIHAYKECIKNIENSSFNMNQGLPQALIRPVISMLSVNPTARISLSEFQSSDYFNNLLVNTLHFLETFLEKTTVEKVQFLKGLPKILPQYSIRFLLRKILPCLLQEFKDPSMIPFILPNLFFVVEKMEADDFASRVLPTLKPIFQSREPPQAILLLLSRCDMLVSKCPTNEIMKQEVLPLIYASFETSTPQIQELGLKALTKIVEKLDFGTIKSVLLPKLCTLYESTSTLSVKINTLIGVHSMMKTLDKFTITEKVLPLLTKRMREPGLMMTILILYEECAKYLDDQAIASQVLPELWKLALDPLFNYKQFQKVDNVIRKLTNEVLDKNKRRLGEMQDETITITNALSETSIKNDFTSSSFSGLQPSSVSNPSTTIANSFASSLTGNPMMSNTVSSSVFNNNPISSSSAASNSNGMKIQPQTFSIPIPGSKKSPNIMDSLHDTNNASPASTTSLTLVMPNTGLGMVGTSTTTGFGSNKNSLGSSVTANNTFSSFNNHNNAFSRGMGMSSTATTSSNFTNNNNEFGAFNSANPWDSSNPKNKSNAVTSGNMNLMNPLQPIQSFTFHSTQKTNANLNDFDPFK